jgi:HK97 gp10 family phage protein
MSDPIKITVDVDPTKIQDLQTQITPILQRFALGMVAEMKRLMSLPKSGILYRRGRVVHQASAPGQPPAVDTGTLTNSISFSFENPLMARIIINAEYASYLENGTARMAARPFIEPAVEAIRARSGGILAGVRQ